MLEELGRVDLVSLHFHLQSPLEGLRRPTICRMAWRSE
jgi:hypothetical protein